MRVIARLTAHNEERFFAGSLRHLMSQRISVYLCDNESTDGAVAIAEQFNGLDGFDRLLRHEWAERLAALTCRPAPE